MSLKTNVPSVVIDNTGIKLPTEDAILAGVLADFNQAFGGNLNLNLDTPQGQLASSLAAIIADCHNQLATLMNQFNPDYAEGAMQDAISKIYFIERKPATDSVVYVDFIGAAGTVIPRGFLVKDASGNLWRLNETISILAEGSVTGMLTASGRIEAPAHTVNTIYKAIVGLDRVDNPSDAIPGKLIESREDFRDRRNRSVAINAHGTPQSVYANVFSVDGVSDVYVIDNPKNEEVKIGATSYSLKPHSIYVAVVGGDDIDIAKVIWKYAGSGCDYNGNTSVIVSDDNYTEPKPSYEIQFMRPTPKPVYFRVKVKPGAPIGYQEVIKKAIIDAFNGQAKIGSDIYSIRFVAPVVKAMPDANILNVEISLVRDSWGNSVSLGVDQQPVISSENIEVVVND